MAVILGRGRVSPQSPAQALQPHTASRDSRIIYQSGDESLKKFVIAHITRRERRKYMRGKEICKLFLLELKARSLVHTCTVCAKFACS